MRFFAYGWGKRLAACALMLMLLAPATSAVAASAAPFDGEAAAAKLEVKLFPISDQMFKITARGVYDALDDIRTAQKSPEECTYHYALTIQSLNGFTLHGTLRYQPGDASPVTRISAFVRYLNTDHDARAVLPDGEGISWIVEVPKRLGLNVRDISGGSISLNSVDEHKLQLSKEITSEELVTDDSAVTVINDMCTLRVTVPEQKKLIVSITDPLLKSGYVNSPEGQGDHTPIWYMKAKISSYLWVEATLDGRESEKLDDSMKFTAGEFHVLKDESNKYHAKAFDLSSASYHIDGDTIVMELTVPNELKHDFRKLIWIELSMNNGTQKSHYRIR